MLVIEHLIFRKEISAMYWIRPRRSSALPDAGLFGFALILTPTICNALNRLSCIIHGPLLPSPHPEAGI